MESESADVVQVSGERLFGDIHHKYPPAILISFNSEQHCQVQST